MVNRTKVKKKKSSTRRGRKKVEDETSSPDLDTAWVEANELVKEAMTIRNRAVAWWKQLPSDQQKHLKMLREAYKAGKIKASHNQLAGLVSRKFNITCSRHQIASFLSG